LYSLLSHNFFEIILNDFQRDKHEVFNHNQNSQSFHSLLDLARITAFFISSKFIQIHLSAIVILSENKFIDISIQLSTLASMELSISSAKA
jgi:hypothetical protein